MKKVLVVEDDVYLSGAYKLKLVKLGFEVMTAGDGEEALARLRDFQPDLILLDLIMPRKDGFETLEALKRNPVWRDIPVLVATNLSQKEDIDRAISLGADDYIVKTDPSMDDLRLKVKSVLKLAHVPASDTI